VTGSCIRPDAKVLKGDFNQWSLWINEAGSLPPIFSFF